MALSASREAIVESKKSRGYAAEVQVKSPTHPDVQVCQSPPLALPSDITEARSATGQGSSSVPDSVRPIFTESGVVSGGAGSVSGKSTMMRANMWHGDRSQKSADARAGVLYSPMLTLRLKKRVEGGSAFTLLRADGTSTWQRQERHASFFAHHDLGHFAVESVLRLHGAFYGLVASGWDFEDFLPPYPRGPLPEEALWAETIVGMLDVERAQQALESPRMSAAELNAQVALKFDIDDRIPPGTVKDTQLAEIRRQWDDLVSQWHALPPGETLELSFSP